MVYTDVLGLVASIWGICCPNQFQEAYAHMASKCFQVGLKLFRLRPKLHMQLHLTLLMGPHSGPVAFSALSC